MDIYRVISETLWRKEPILDNGTGPDEPYAIAHLVATRKPSRAKYLAAMTSNNFSHDPRE